MYGCWGVAVPAQVFFQQTTLRGDFMAIMLPSMFQHSILLCSFGGIGSSIEILFAFLGTVGLTLLSIIGTLVLIVRRFWGRQNSEPISIFSGPPEDAEAV